KKGISITGIALLIDHHMMIRHVSYTEELQHKIKREDYIGRTCYQALWELNTPCSCCPLGRQRRPESTIHQNIQQRLLSCFNTEASESIIPIQLDQPHYLLLINETRMETKLMQILNRDGDVPDGHKAFLKSPNFKEYLDHLYFFHQYSTILGRYSLTPTEQEVVTYILRNHPSKEIAQRLYISKKAVDFHRQNIRKKLGITGRKTTIGEFLLRLKQEVGQ
ncbi:MAG TPA: LuxR family transcriptional regulator, partial [Sediminispirochaeta sp.]|nr:LuxR family transcriptional regulator [Sediminispirochaeta sp.]